MLKNIRAQLRLAAVLSLSRARMFFSTAWVLRSAQALSGSLLRGVTQMLERQHPYQRLLLFISALGHVWRTEFLTKL